ncbi:hypothetical protein NKG05_28060 [Oerskovia sp. M15]
MNQPALSPWGLEARFAGTGAHAAQVPTGPGVEETDEAWPQGISRRATMRISDVLRALRTEFPASATRSCASSRTKD